MTDDPSADSEFISYASPFKTRNWLTWIADRNPFFLISAACMLWGCLSLTNSSSWNSVPLPRLLLLIGTLNVYEGALIAVALLLIGRGLLRDGKILLILEAFFLVDVAFLSAEVVTANLRVGMTVNTILLVLAAVKLLAIRPVMRGALTTPRLLFVLTQMLALLALPCYFRRVDDGSLSPLLFYGAWWVVGLMPAAGLLIRRLFKDQPAPPLRGMAGLFVCLPWVAMIAHLGILHYAYSVQYLPAMAAPVLLGLTLALSRLPLAPVSKNVNASSLKWMLPVAAVLVSMGRPKELDVYLFRSSTAINTLMLTLAATYFTVIYCYLWRHAFSLVLGGVSAGAALVFGPSVAQIEAVVSHGWNRIVDATNFVMPKNVIQWGMVSVAASFFFLMIGAAISLKRAPGSSVES